jgi:hypothetical protein
MQLALASSLGLLPPLSRADSSAAARGVCKVEPAQFEGWKAEKIANEWVELIIVPQLGGRLMQVTFAGHHYLFVNHGFAGKYFPPSEGAAKGKWFNYGGDKIWPMPEGSEDDQHWPGPISDALDDGEYAFTVLSQGTQCTVRLAGPPDERTGLQYTREISVDGESPEISFHATMKNASTHPIRWSVQSVTQYDTADAAKPDTYNRDLWAFTPANPQSSYLDGYHVRSGLAEDPSYSVKNGLFKLHWLYLQGEVWVDSPGSWLAVVDGSTHFAMVERFRFQNGAEYPGKASVIFYKNGPAVDIDNQGAPVIRTSPDDAPFYMEAELNSPMADLKSGESYTFSTEWFPTRMGSNFKNATDAGVISEPLAISASSANTEVFTLTGSFGVFFAGKLVARLYDDGGSKVAAVPLESVIPVDMVKLNQAIRISTATTKISIHLIDRSGVDRGSLGDSRQARTGFLTMGITRGGVTLVLIRSIPATWRNSARNGFFTRRSPESSRSRRWS